MIYLDTHVIIWLYFGKSELLTRKAKELINEHDIYISPILQLELQYLLEIDKIKVSAKKIIETLKKDIDLKICSLDFHHVIQESLTCHWTRDPFDRIIVAQAAFNKNILLTKDRKIQKHYKLAQWD